MKRPTGRLILLATGVFHAVVASLRVPRSEQLTARRPLRRLSTCLGFFYNPRTLLHRFCFTGDSKTSLKAPESAVQGWFFIWRLLSELLRLPERATSIQAGFYSIDAVLALGGSSSASKEDTGCPWLAINPHGGLRLSYYRPYLACDSDHHTNC